MNPDPESTSCCSDECRTKCIYFAAILGALLIVLALDRAMIHYTAPAASKAPARAKERADKLAEVRKESAEALGSYGWQDKTKGLVRLPVDRAMELTLQRYKNPAVSRSNLIERVEKATALPPKPPEKPSPFE